MGVVVNNYKENKIVDLFKVKSPKDIKDLFYEYIYIYKFFHLVDVKTLNYKNEEIALC